MSLNLNVAVGGSSGVSISMILVGGLLYETNIIFSAILLLVGISLGVATSIVGLYVMYMDAESRRKEAEARAQWAPFTYQ